MANIQIFKYDKSSVIDIPITNLDMGTVVQWQRARLAYRWSRVLIQAKAKISLKILRLNVEDTPD